MAFHDDLTQFPDADTLSLRFAGAGVGDAGGFDQGGNPAALTLGPHPPQESVAPGMAPSLGLGKAARDEEDLKYLQGLPTVQKIGLMLQSFSAGVAGRPNPIDNVLAQHRAERIQRRADLHETINVISKGMDVLRKLPPGLQRDAVAKRLGEAVGGGEMGKVFEVAGQQQEEEVKRVLRTFGDPGIQEKLLSACASAPDFNACVLQQARDKDAMARFQREVNAKRMPAILAKLTKIQDGIKAGALKEHAGEDGKLNISFGKLLELNARTGTFSEHEMDTIRDNQEMLIDYGIRTEKSMGAGQAEAEKQKAKPEKDLKQPPTITVGGKVYQYDPEKKITGPRLDRDPRYAALGPSKSPKEERGLTPYQEVQLEDRYQETLNAREQLEKMGVNWKTGEGKEKYTRPNKPNRPGSSYTVVNPDYDPSIRELLSKAKRNVPASARGERGGEAAPAAAPKPAPREPADDVPKKFASDPQMRGNTLGKQTPKGYEVFKNGKLIGHYR